MNYNALFTHKLDALKEQGSYRHFLEVNKSAQHFPNFYYTNGEGVKRSAINWCSNDYLCMSTHVLFTKFAKMLTSSPFTDS